MFSPAELRPDDPGLRAARHAAMAALVSVSGVAGHADPAAAVPDAALLSWAMAHGLLILSSDGALAAATGATDADALAHALLQRFAETVELGPAG